jgi:hypothetical protein
VSSNDLFGEILVRVCGRFVQRMMTLHDELLNLEFLLEADECAEYRERLDDLTESLFSDLYLVFGPTVVDDQLEQAMDSLFDSAWGFRRLLQQAIEQMSARESRCGEGVSVQDCVDPELREEAKRCVSAASRQANDVIQLSAAFVRNLAESRGRAKDEPFN